MQSATELMTTSAMAPAPERAVADLAHPLAGCGIRAGAEAGRHARLGGGKAGAVPMADPVPLEEHEAAMILARDRRIRRACGRMRQGGPAPGGLPGPDIRGEEADPFLGDLPGRVIHDHVLAGPSAFQDVPSTARHAVFAAGTLPAVAAGAIACIGAPEDGSRALHALRPGRSA